MDYDVTISFAGEDRQYAEQLAKMLTSANIKVFYDRYEEGKLWGEDLYTHLAEVYSKKARYCVMIISRHYLNKLWTNHERRFAQERAFSENSPYILPLRLDDTEVPGLAATVGYIDLRTTTLQHVIDLIIGKLNNLPDRPSRQNSTTTAHTAYAAAVVAAHQPTSQGQYIPLRAAFSGQEPRLVEDLVNEMVRSADKNFLIILGGYGSGKTTLCKQLRRKYCQQLLDGTGENVVPIYVDLRRSSNLLRSPEPFAAIRASISPAAPEADGVTYLLLLDGFDEVLRDRHELSIGALLETDYSGRRVKTILTSRTHFFRTELDAAKWVAGAASAGTGLVDTHNGAEAALRNAVELQQFTSDDVRRYLTATFPAQWSSYYQKLLRIYDLGDLAKRPILLDLIVTVLPGIDESETITEASLYETAIRRWLDREFWRGVDATAILDFMKSLAVQMFFDNRLEINYRELTERVRRDLSQNILSAIDLERFDEIIRTSSFLSRDAAGNFSFMHRSIMEYFFAKEMEDRISNGTLRLMRKDGPAPISRWELDSPFRDKNVTPEQLYQSARVAVGINFDRFLPLSEGIVELLASSLRQNYPDHDVTHEVNKFARERVTFREKERRLEKVAQDIRSGGQAKIPPKEAVPNITMVGGGGRIYYTLEIFEFSLLVCDGDQANSWTFLMNKSTSWRHT